MNTIIDTGNHAGTHAGTGRVVPGSAPYTSAQGSVYTPGISAETVGAAALFLGVVTIPPGQRTKAHVHALHESAFYMLSGEEVELWTGPRLQHRAVAHPGDYLFIPAGTAHVAVNCSAVQPAVFVGARNEATAQESMVLRPELDSLVQ
ncbi:cupin domain-containing protein [Ideonella sp.]|uniref:cupin domain-containing protein n=1 Tax=Ideonella sp. TaxID=1929293 RepID=UPI002B45DBFD|nr:cupin domain-containing protein [Ideonella sp.]HJV71544.1 cupin domain-containing protein [Ideonella sp.]